MCDVRTDVKNRRVENSEDFLVFSEEDVSDEVDRVFDLELSSASQVDIKGDDSEHGTSLSSSICNSQIGIMPEEAKEDEGYRWKKMFEDEKGLRIKEVEERKRTEKNLKHARRCCCDLRVKLRKAKRRCLEKESLIREITVLSQEYM